MQVPTRAFPDYSFVSSRRLLRGFALRPAGSKGRGAGYALI
eukprot:SAG31_NODE_38505_length_295_cov_1.637755_1_plen_40_part_10